MTYESEHRRMKPVLDKVRELDVSKNPDVLAVFDPLLAGFNIWCNPFDCPRGWAEIKMDTGAYAQPCEYVGTATWGWEDERISHVELETDAYTLSDRDKGERYHRDYHNRPEDVEWCSQKILWLFTLAGIPLSPDPRW